MLLCDFAVPKGARQLDQAPAVDGERLTGAVASQAGPPNMIELNQWWLVPGKPVAVLAWERKHVRGALKMSSAGTQGRYGTTYVWFDAFSSSAGPQWLNQQHLSVAVAAAGENTDVAVSAQVNWIPARPASEKVPATARAVTISEDLGRNHGKQRAPKPVTITAPTKVRKLVALVNGLPLFPPGSYSCPSPTGAAVTLKFRAAPGQTPLAVATDALSGCTHVGLTIGGRSQPGLAALSARAIFKIAGLPWQVPRP